MKNSIAVRRDYKNKEGNYDSDFFNFTVWGVQCEFLEKYAKKGDKVILSGKILNNNYEKDGQTVYSNDIQVDNIELLRSKPQTEDDDELPFDDDVVEIDNKKAEDSLLD